MNHSKYLTLFKRSFFSFRILSSGNQHSETKSFFCVLILNPCGIPQSSMSCSFLPRARKWGKKKKKSKKKKQSFV